MQYTIYTLIGLTILVLMLGGLTLPSILEMLVQKRMRQKLTGMAEFEGKFEKLNLQFTRLGFSVYGLQLDRKDNELPEPFLRVARFSVELNWTKTLAQRRLMGRMWVERAKINFVMGQSDDAPDQEASEDEENVSDKVYRAVSGFLPYPVDSLTVVDGEVHIYDTYAATPIDLHLYDIDMWGTGFQKKRKKDNALVGHLDASMKTVGDGRLSLNTDFDPWEPRYTTRSKLLLMNLHLVDINPFIRSYTTLDAKTGLLEAFAEIATADGRVEGYIKPFLDDLVMTRKTERRPFLQSLIRQSLDLVISGMENGNEESLATRIPIRGRLEGPGINYWRSLLTLIQHGFVDKLTRDYDIKVNPQTMKKLQKEAARLKRL